MKILTNLNKRISSHLFKHSFKFFSYKLDQRLIELTSTIDAKTYDYGSTTLWLEQLTYNLSRDRYEEFNNTLNILSEKPFDLNIEELNELLSYSFNKSSKATESIYNYIIEKNIPLNSLTFYYLIQYSLKYKGFTAAYNFFVEANLLNIPHNLTTIINLIKNAENFEDEEKKNVCLRSLLDYIDQKFSNDELELLKNLFPILTNQDKFNNKKDNEKKKSEKRKNKHFNKKLKFLKKKEKKEEIKINTTLEDNSNSGKNVVIDAKENKIVQTEEKVIEETIKEKEDEDNQQNKQNLNSFEQKIEENNENNNKDTNENGNDIETTTQNKTPKNKLNSIIQNINSKEQRLKKKNPKNKFKKKKKEEIDNNNDNESILKNGGLIIVTFSNEEKDDDGESSDE